MRNSSLETVFDQHVHRSEKLNGLRPIQFFSHRASFRTEYWPFRPHPQTHQIILFLLECTDPQKCWYYRKHQQWQRTATATAMAIASSQLCTRNGNYAWDWTIWYFPGKILKLNKINAVFFVVRCGCDSICAEIVPDMILNDEKVARWLQGVEKSWHTVFCIICIFAMDANVSLTLNTCVVIFIRALCCLCVSSSLLISFSCDRIIL